MWGVRTAIGEIGAPTAPAFNADLRATIAGSDEVLACVDGSALTFADSTGYRTLVTALVASYPHWTDENGTNIEQLAAIAVAALEEAGLLEQDHEVHNRF
jgi:hypothetical protein